MYKFYISLQKDVKMNQLYINPALEKSIKSYCFLNNIDDVNAFTNRCILQGFNIIKFGISPKDNIYRENNGIKDIQENGTNSKEKESFRKDERKQNENKEPLGKEEESKKESIPIKEKITVRKIQIVKKK